MASPDPEVTFSCPKLVSRPHEDELSDTETIDEYHSDVDLNAPTSHNNRPSTHDTNPRPRIPRPSQNYNYNDNHGDHHQPPMPHNAPYKIKPDTYDGSSSFERYISHFNDCSELSMWDQRTKVLMLATSLRGRARDFYSSLPEMERRNYDLLTDRLTLRFGVSGKPQCSWLNKLESRKRQKSESIASLADDIRQLCQKAYSDLDYYAQEKLALNQLYKLISPEMRCRCIDRDCATVNQAVSIIERYESILGTQHNDIRAYESSQPAKPDTSLETILQRIESRLDKIESGDRQAQNRSRVCFGCNASDHLWSSCPQNSRSRPDNLSRNQNRSPNHRFDSPRNDRYPQNTTHNTQHYAQRNQHSHYPQYNNDQPPVRNNNNRRYPQPQSLVQEN